MIMVIETTMTGSYFRNKELLDVLLKSKTGEVPEDKLSLAYEAEKQVVLDQLHPNGNKKGLDWVSNGEQRKAGYTTYLPNRFYGFSPTETLTQNFSKGFADELLEVSSQLALDLGESTAFKLPKIEQRLEYHGEKQAKDEAKDAKRIRDETGAKRIFIPAASPGVVTIFYPRTEVYDDHQDYLLSLSRELRKEYEAILSVDGVDLQIDAPDLAMAASLGVNWGVDFFDALPLHVQAINDAIKGLPTDRIRVHYCYGNYSAAHLTDPAFDRVLEQLTQLKVGTLVGEMANGRHQGDPVTLRKYAKEHGWPKLKYAIGAIDVKSPFVETPETVALRLQNVASIEQIGPENVLGGTDCGFETFENFGNVPKTIAEKKLQSLVKGAELATQNL